MKDFRKAQMKLALLLEIEAEPKKNSEVIKGAEERLILDDAYNRLMKNGKQTIGSKEMQFLLYYIKRDDIADLPSRGMYQENENTVSEREQLISDILEVLNIDVVVLNGVHNEYFFGITTGQAAKVAKDFAHMLFSGKIC